MHSLVECINLETEYDSLVCWFFTSTGISEAGLHLWLAVDQVADGNSVRSVVSQRSVVVTFSKIISDQLPNFRERVWPLPFQFHAQPRPLWINSTK